MYICDFDIHKAAGLARATARVIWEERDLPPMTFFLETPAGHAGGFWCDPNALLLAAFLPAWRAGERRVRVASSICPVLRQNLRGAAVTLQMWYPHMGAAPTIECSRVAAGRPEGRHAVSLLSCGIDSLAILRWNKLHIPEDHPAAIEGCVSISFEKTPSASAEEFGQRVRGQLEPATAVASDAGVDAIPVVSNMWWLVNNGYFYDEQWHGAVLASAVAFFNRRFDRGYIASSSYPGNLSPWGSHPGLDPYYSSSQFQIEHHGLGMTRLERTALVADWPAGLQNIRVCQKDDPAVNCGTCEKCIRTMIALVCLGRLRECIAFPVDDVSAELIETLGTYEMLHNNHHVPYQEMVPALTQRGRDDLTAALRGVIQPYLEREGL